MQFCCLPPLPHLWYSPPAPRTTPAGPVAARPRTAATDAAATRPAFKGHVASCARWRRKRELVGASSAGNSARCCRDAHTRAATSARRCPIAASRCARRGWSRKTYQVDVPVYKCEVHYLLPTMQAERLPFRTRPPPAQPRRRRFQCPASRRAHRRPPGDRDRAILTALDGPPACAYNPAGGVFAHGLATMSGRSRTTLARRPPGTVPNAVVQQRHACVTPCFSSCFVKLIGVRDRLGV